ncbi:Vesicle-associated protein 4-1 [Dendrobium catenatum]|uniref:Vesicle-associated protein 4-1 n=1 Tax=Dendrobium catenatum TaxID=906689 RepID=A0A2I0VV57_9ASPA|nr:Vesicle-associated protein 4-1 [Dendrobium catenatum]
MAGRGRQMENSGVYAGFRSDRPDLLVLEVAWNLFDIDVVRMVCGGRTTLEAGIVEDHIFVFLFLVIASSGDEPGKQVRSAIRIKNTRKSYVAFKAFGSISLIDDKRNCNASALILHLLLKFAVFKFVEHPENNEKPLLDQKNKVKFKIMSLKVKVHMEYVPELELLLTGDMLS